MLYNILSPHLRQTDMNTEQALDTAVKGFTKYLKVWCTAVHIPAHFKFLSTQLYVREVRTLAYEHSDGLKI
jgi:hypothetical protein